MPAVERTISAFCEDHRKAMLAAAAMTWVLLIALMSLAMAAEPLKIGGLPVT